MFIGINVQSRSPESGVAELRVADAGGIRRTLDKVAAQHLAHRHMLAYIAQVQEI